MRARGLADIRSVRDRLEDMPMQVDCVFDAGIDI